MLACFFYCDFRILTILPSPLWPVSKVIQEAKKPFLWFHVNRLREYLASELRVPTTDFRFDPERGIDDWVFLCFFVGNDFLPHLPSLEIREGAIDTLLDIYKKNLPMMGGYLTDNGEVWSSSLFAVSPLNNSNRLLPLSLLFFFFFWT